MPLRETKIAPVFFIGLGGCGGAIVDELARKVKQEESFQRYSDLIQFFAMDTDVDDLARLHWIDNAHKFGIADFAKPDYVQLKRGQLHAKEDPLFTQWWPAWYLPRSAKGKGAGQIRLESRMALYYQLENDRGKIVESLEKAIRRAYDVHNPYRANKAAKIYVYASLAGGTGSGGFATMALTIRRLLGGQRGHIIIGTFVMPNVFKAKGLPPNQFDKVMANGYSALQELELLQSASPTMSIEFHTDPDDPAHTTIDRPPFDQVYLIEEKTQDGVVIADSSHIYHAIADTAHTQIFSPILDKEGSTLDNDTRELMQLDDQSFTKSFGSFGISALVLPTQDILEYLALRLGRELMVGAVPGGVAALGDGATLDEADQAFASGVKDKAEGSSEDAQIFTRMHQWAAGGGDAGEGVLSTFLRRCKEDVAKDIDRGVKLRGWDETELASFEDDPERVKSELASAWTALGKQLTTSEEEARRRAERSADEVISGTGPMSLTEILRGKGPTDSRYLYIELRQAMSNLQEETRQAYDKAVSYDNSGLQEEFRRQVELCAETAPRTFFEKLPTRENDYFETASAFANWYRETLGKLSRRIRANAMLEFCSRVLAELDRRRQAALAFFARIDRVIHVFEERAGRLLARGGIRQDGGHANEFILDVEVLQDHRTGQRLWHHLYQELVTPGDMQISDALPRLAEIAAEGGTEQDIQRRIVDNLLEVTRKQLRARVTGARDSIGLAVDAELAREGRIAIVARRFERDSESPPVTDPRWAEEMQRVSEEDVATYVKDKLDHAASKCQPFITLGVGAPYLPEKAYCVLYARYRDTLGRALSQLSALTVDRDQIINGEDPHKIVFYVAKLGCALHAIKSLVDYERRYLAVKSMELEESAKVPGLPPGVPQIPIHQDANWEGAPSREKRLFRVSIQGVKDNDAKLAWMQRNKQMLEEARETAEALDDLTDFTMGVAFGYIKHEEDGAAGPGYYLEDHDLRDQARRLGKFRDQAFANYRDRNDPQKQWLHRSWAKSLASLEEERDFERIKSVFEAHIQAMDSALKNADVLGGKPFAMHVQAEKDSFIAFRKQRGL